MTAHLKHHLLDHWHHHALLWGTLVSGIAFFAGAGAATYVAHGGYQRGPLPPRVAVNPIAGGPLPTSASLAASVVRIHNQGDSNSCVGQTLATITEITTAEYRARRVPFSAGYIYDQINGGSDGGSSYSDAFEVLRTQGDAPLRFFPHDGQDWWIQPDTLSHRTARTHHILAWRSVDPSDRYTISYEIAHGRPVAIAIPVTDSFYNQWSSPSLPTVSAPAGNFHFWHSITAIGYDPAGVIVLNSWGPSYGYGGMVRLSWDFLTSVGAAVVVSTPKTS